MFVIISELSEQAAVQVMHLWRRLNQSCGLQGIFNYPNPHFTWFSAEELEVDHCKPILEVIAKETQPFTIHTSAIEVFEGDDPVLYLKIVPTDALLGLHRTIWNQILPYVKNPSDYHSPEEWTPHITLSLRDLTHENLPCAIESIAHETLQIYSVASTISLVKSEKKQTGETIAVFDFSAGWE